MLESLRIMAGRSALGAAGRISVALLTVSLLTAGHATAAITTWIGSSTGGVFNDDSNWSLEAPGNNTPFPNGPNDHAIFDDGTNVDGTITFDADATHLRTSIRNTSGTISFDAGDHKWTMTSYLEISPAGVNGFPHVRHVGGEIEAAFLIFGNNENSANPLFELTGPNTHFHTTQGSGGYQIGTGPLADGTTMLVHNGARMSADGQTIVGLQGSRNGKLTIDGEGTVFFGGNYLATGYTGYFGIPSSNNTIEIINGAVATASHVLMAITANATSNNNFLISGAGSKLSLTGVNNNDGAASAIGWRDSNNVFRIEGGGVVDGTNRFVLGLEATSSNNLLEIDNGSLSGTELEINQGSVVITNGTVDLIQYFNEAPEQMVYQGGGIVATNAGSSIFTFNSGTVRSVNAEINNGAPFTIGDGGTDSARYQMRKDVADNHGTHTFTNGLVLASNGILSGDGDMVGNVSGSAGAQVEVGASAGLMNVTGDWDNSGLTLHLELLNLGDSLVPGEQFDQLNITGLFTHGGTVTIDRSALVAPADVEPLKLIGWGSEAGLPSSTTVSFLGGSPLLYDFLSDGLYVTVSATSPGLAGDFNNNGAVENADLTLLLNNWGNAVPPTPAGWTGTPPTAPAIDNDELTLLLNNWGTTAGSGAALDASAIPEPGTLVLGWFAALLAASLASRRRTTASRDN